MTGGPQRISLLLHGEPITVGGQLIQPVARLAGWWQTFGRNRGGALVRLSPDSVTVQRNGQVQKVLLADPTRNSLRILLLISGAVSFLCLLVMLLTMVLSRRR